MKGDDTFTSDVAIALCMSFATIINSPIRLEKSTFKQLVQFRISSLVNVCKVFSVFKFISQFVKLL